MIARGKEDNSRNLSGYYQLPQSVKRQLQALFCARSDCRHGRNHHDTDSVSAVLVRFHAPILVTLSKVCTKNTGINFAVYILRKKNEIDQSFFLFVSLIISFNISSKLNFFKEIWMKS